KGRRLATGRTHLNPKEPPMKITVHPFDGETPSSEPYTIIETWDELDPDVIRRYLVVGLVPTSPLAQLNAALGQYISDGADEGDGMVRWSSPTAHRNGS